VLNRADGCEYAVKASKKLFRTRNERRLLLREVEHSQALGECEHIVRYYRAWQDQRSLYLQLELCELGTLRAHAARLCAPAHGGPAQPLAERFVWAFAAQLGAGLAHIHSHGLMHLDIKPENVLVSREGELKIGDLGLCVSQEEWEEEVSAAAAARRRERARRPRGQPRAQRGTAREVRGRCRHNPVSPYPPLPRPRPARLRRPLPLSLSPSLPPSLPLSPSLSLCCAAISARSLRGASAVAQEGDAVYIAPELLQAQPSARCDIFSLGLVLYELAAMVRAQPAHARTLALALRSEAATGARADSRQR
jgi:serine/threonine protein kinase